MASTKQKKSKVLLSLTAVAGRELEAKEKSETEVTILIGNTVVDSADI